MFPASTCCSSLGSSYKHETAPTLQSSARVSNFGRLKSLKNFELAIRTQIYCNSLHSRRKKTKNFSMRNVMRDIHIFFSVDWRSTLNLLTVDWMICQREPELRAILSKSIWRAKSCCFGTLSISTFAQHFVWPIASSAVPIVYLLLFILLVQGGFKGCLCHAFFLGECSLIWAVQIYCFSVYGKNLSLMHW